MTTFFNINLNKSINWKFLFKHLLFCLIWTCGLLIFIFRSDLYLTISLSENLRWINWAIPVTFTFLIIVLIVIQKWYYSIILLFYPLFVIIWFLPKFILSKGKIYLLLNYIDFIFNKIKKFKSTIFNTGLFILVIFSLIISDSIIIRIISMIILSYYYIRFIYGYLKKSFQPAQYLGKILIMNYKNL